MNIGKLLAVGCALVTFAAVATSIWLDPPAEYRAHAMDGKRLGRLRTVESSISAYFNLNQKLPANLEVLDEQRHRLTSDDWHDPATGQPFEYEIIGDRSYKLCATFERASEERFYSYGYKHNAGHDCFENKITPPIRP